MVEIVKKPKLRGEIISQGSYEDLQPLLIRFKPKNTFCLDSVKVSLTISQDDLLNDAIYGLDFTIGGNPSNPTYSQANSGALGIITFIYDSSHGEYLLEIIPKRTAPRTYWDGRRIHIKVEPNQQIIETTIAASQTISLGSNVVNLGEDYLVEAAPTYDFSFSTYDQTATISADNFSITQENTAPAIGSAIRLGSIGISTSYGLVVDPPSPSPTIQFQSAVTPLVFTESDPAQTITIERTGDITKQSFAQVFVVSGSATLREDYSLSPYADILFEPGQATFNLTFRPYADVRVESTENLILEIIPVNNAVLGARSTLEIQITNV